MGVQCRIRIRLKKVDPFWLQDTLPLAIEQAQKLTLKSHPHTGADPVPAFHTEEDIAAALALAKRRKTVVITPSIRKRTLPSEGPPVKPAATPPASQKAAKSVPKVEDEVAPVAKSVPKDEEKVASASAVQSDGDWKVLLFCKTMGRF
jgi:hypothetical protein